VRFHKIYNTVRWCEFSPSPQRNIHLGTSNGKSMMGSSAFLSGEKNAFLRTVDFNYSLMFLYAAQHADIQRVFEQQPIEGHQSEMFTFMYNL
jgi:hypothetical protein